MTTVLRVLGWLGLLAIWVLSLVPGEARPHTFAPSQFEHVAAYFTDASVLALAYPEGRRPVGIAIMLAVCAAVLEIAQLWVPGRNARVLDVFAGSIGAWIGVAFISLILWMLSSSQADAKSSK